MPCPSSSPAVKTRWAREAGLTFPDDEPYFRLRFALKPVHDAMRTLLRHYLHSHSQLAQFLRFATVGVKVSAIDAGLVYFLPWCFGTNLYLARVISLGTAIFVGYLLNRAFTFGRSRRGCFYRQLVGHFGVHLTGGLINYGIFSAAITIGHACLKHPHALFLLPLAAIWVGGLIGMGFNFVFSRRFVFNPQASNASAPL